MLPIRRFNKIHEQILLSQTFSFISGWLIVALMPLLVLQQMGRTDTGTMHAFYISCLAFILTNYGVKHLLQAYPGGKSLILLTTQVFSSYALIFFIFLFLRFEFSRLLFITSGALAFVWFFIEYKIFIAYKSTKLAIINKGFSKEILNLKNLKGFRINVLHNLNLNDKRYDGIVADFNTLTPDEERFLTRCALKSIPVYNAKNIYESISGRVRINHMSENNIGALLPSPALERIKSLMDCAFIIITAPIVIPLCLITALAIRLESPGPVIYTQTRIGKGNKPFTIYKFRSMRFDVDAPQQFAGEADPRITRIGKFIRKTRIDELPQFFNILKGDMSLIGPRPEQPDFVKEFDEKIPFYSYRHVVKPGITGWAQVRQGYAADVNETQVKIEHDFYYIKNYSLQLDVFIILLTIRTVLTGFGAR